MSTSMMERKLSLIQTIVFKHIGKKFPTNTLKGLMDALFVIVEKVGCKFEVVSSLYLKLYQDIVSKELTMVHVSPQDHVLVIGGGSLPATPALIAMNTKATVVSIDHDRTAVADATRFVKSHHLGRTLLIEYADGLHFPVERFNVIFILYGVKQPNLLLEYLAEHCHDTTRIVLRAIADAKGMIADRTINISTHFLVRDQTRTDMLGSITSFFLQKKSVSQHHTLVI